MAAQRFAQSQNFRVQKSAGKVVASIFWYQDVIFLIDYLPKGQTISADYYSPLLLQLKDILKDKRGGNVTNVFPFLHGNAPAHRTLATLKKLVYLCFQCLDYPPYSPDLNPSNSHLCPGRKKAIENSLYFVRRGGHCCRGDLVGWTNSELF